MDDGPAGHNSVPFLQPCTEISDFPPDGYRVREQVQSQHPKGAVAAVLECVINVSEGRDRSAIDRLAAAGGPYALDAHADGDHHRSVITLCGPDPELAEAVRAVARATVELIDLRAHAGVHPRIGALDVVPFVGLGRGPSGLLSDGSAERAERAVTARDAFAAWAGDELALPCFVYGPERSLPDLRRHAWTTLAPATGPDRPHPTAGAAAVGARPVLVAYNLWLSAGADRALARRVAAEVRSPRLRTLGLQVGDLVQVSCNLIDPWRLGPGAAFDAVATALRGEAAVDHAELVGLLPRAVLEAEPHHRWAELGIGLRDTIEARLEQAGLDGGST